MFDQLKYKCEKYKERQEINFIFFKCALNIKGYFSYLVISWHIANNLHTRKYKMIKITVREDK